MKRDLARLLRQARDRGWEVQSTRGGHWQLLHPTGGIVVTGSTPSDRRALKNLAADLKRAERRATP